ncbi:MAG: 16S rRNA (uracil(1498)-N(3))-methyltransferase [Acidobacteria bacterium]|nr:16S rRNA (uracil(1498)-N(3))-methyltransferase [Acidobacteriota bacterium]
MNLVLLFPEDFVAEARVRLQGRRWAHVRQVHRVGVGDALRVGLLGGAMGIGKVRALDAEALEMEVVLDQPPPPKLPLSLVLALPRPKVLNRVLASATSLGVARMALVNAWKVERAYWGSPKLEPDNLRRQLLLGLEQSRDTVMPELSIGRLFRPFVEERLDAWAGPGTRLLAHPGAAETCPVGLPGGGVVAIGPEGGWIDEERESLRRAGFREVDLGPRILRVETALAALVGRLC